MTWTARIHADAKFGLGDSPLRVMSGVTLWLALALTGLTACSVDITPAPRGFTPTLPLPTLSATTPTPALSNATPSIGASEVVTLTIWAPEEFAPSAVRGGAILQRQVDEFTRTHPKIAIQYALKSRYGRGGLLDFMLQVQSLVPARLPDVVLIDSREVDAGAQANVFQPLERDLPAGAFADLLPPARAIAQYNGQHLVMPLILDLQHLVYNQQVVREPPATWDKFLAANVPLTFPADGDDAFLLQYLDNNGRLTASPQSGALDVGATTTVLTFYQRARAANLVPDVVFGLKTTHDVWPFFAAGQAALAQVEASDYVAERDRTPNANYAPVPTREGRATTLVNAWCFAIVASDASRHVAAAEFLNWLSDPTRIAEWSNAAHTIPARRSAFALAVRPREYADFLLKLMDTGFVAPTFAERAPYSAAWRAALQSVLRGQATPGEASLKAAQSVLP